MANHGANIFRGGFYFCGKYKHYSTVQYAADLKKVCFMLHYDGGIPEYECKEATEL